MRLNPFPTFFRQKIQSRWLLSSLLICILSLSFISYWLLFRDVRALEGMEVFYPQLQGRLGFFREILLENGLNVIPTFLFAAAAAGAFACYALLLRAHLAQEAVIRWTIIIQLIAFLAYPVLSTDIFSYIFSDRVLTEYNQNVWLVTPDTYPEDKFFIFADWKDQTKVYGVVNQIAYLPAAYLGGDDLLVTVVLYKLTALIFVFAAMWVLLQVTDDLSEKNRSLLLRLLFWNPLVVLEFAGSGHNDIIMLFFVLLSILFWKKRLWLWAGLALAAAVQVKLIPIVLFGFLGWYLLQKRNWRALAEFTGGFALANTTAFLAMQVNPLEFLQRVLYNTSVYWQSLPNLAERFFPGQSFPFSLMFGGVGVVLLFLQWQRRWHPIFTTVVALLAYLLFFTAAYWNWYVLWVLFLIPFLKETWLKNMILAFSFTSLLAYPLLWLGQRYALGSRELETFWMVLTYLWLVGVPVLVGVVGKWRVEVVERVLLER